MVVVVCGDIIIILMAVMVSVMLVEVCVPWKS